MTEAESRSDPVSLSPDTTHLRHLARESKVEMTVLEKAKGLQFCCCCTTSMFAIAACHASHIRLHVLSTRCCRRSTNSMTLGSDGPVVYLVNGAAQDVGSA